MLGLNTLLTSGSIVCFTFNFHHENEDNTVSYIKVSASQYM